MNNSLIAGRYAKALLLQAESEGVAGELYALLREALGGALALPEVGRVLASPTHTKEQKRGVLLNLSTAEWPTLWERFVALVLEANREGYMAAIARHYLRLYRQRHNIVVVNLTTTKPADSQTVGRIEQLVADYYGGAQVELCERVDESIEGGFVLSVGDHRLDASLRGQIEQIRTQLLKRNKTLV